MIFLGRDIGEQRDYSELTAQAIDEEVRRIIDEAHAHCRSVIEAHRDKLVELATVLIEDETLEGDALLLLLGPAEGRSLPEAQPTAGVTPPTPENPDGPLQEERPRVARALLGPAIGRNRARRLTSEVTARFRRDRVQARPMQPQRCRAGQAAAGGFRGSPRTSSRWSTPTGAVVACSG